MAGYEFDSFRFDAKTGILSKDEEEIPLRPMAGKLLLVFLENPESVFSKDDLKLRVWDQDVLDGTLTTLLHDLRVALGRRPDGGVYIRNLTRRGYQFSAPVHKRIQVETDGWFGDSNHGNYATEGQQINQVAAPTIALPVEGSKRRRRALLVLGSALALVCAGAIVAAHFRPAPQLRIVGYSQLTMDGHDKNVAALLTDGTRVYFRKTGPDGPPLIGVSVHAGETDVISLAVGDGTFFDLSRQGSEFLVGLSLPDRKDSELWIVPLAGSRRRVGDLKADFARWSPDQRQIAFTLEDAVFVANADGSESRKVASVPGEATDIDWSPDGGTLRFTQSSYNNNEQTQLIWEVATDGSNLHPLLKGWNVHPSECCGTWTPDGKFYIFQSSRDGHHELWALPESQGFFWPASGSPVQITHAPLDFFRPVVAPDGKGIFAIGKQSHGELVRLDSRLHEFVPFLKGISATWVSFARSGKKLAYEAYPEGTVWIADAVDSNNKTQITFPPHEVDGFSWSPDGSQLALRAKTTGKPFRIYLIPSVGGDPKELMPGNDEQGIPTWSPDGKEIAFGDVPAVFERPSGTEAIHIFELSTRRLTELPGSRGLWTARWSPNGRFVAALTIVGQKLMLYDVGRKKWRQTAADKINNPNWSADSKFIYYDTEGSERLLRRIGIADGRVVTLFDLNNYAFLAGNWSGLAPDDSPLILRNLGASDIYSLALEIR